MKVKLEKNKYGFALSVTRNGWQWTSLDFDDINEVKQLSDDINKLVDKAVEIEKPSEEGLGT